MYKCYKVVRYVNGLPNKVGVHRRRISASTRQQQFTVEYSVNVWVTSPIGKLFVFCDEDLARSFQASISLGKLRYELWLARSTVEPVPMARQARRWEGILNYWGKVAHGSLLEIVQSSIETPEGTFGVPNLLIYERIG